MVVVIIFSLMEGCHAKKEGDGSNRFQIIDIGQKAPDMPMVGIDGEIFRLDRFNDKVIVLNFWATWCPPCTKEMPLLESTYKRYKEKGFVIVGINYNEDKERVSEFVNKAGVTFPIVIDNELKLTRTYRVLSLPATFFIDRKGIIRDIYRGEIHEKIIASKVGPLILQEKGH